MKSGRFPPDDTDFINFLRMIGRLLSGPGKARIRIPSLTPNDIAVALWVKVEDVAVLLGSDLEKRGWTAVLENARTPGRKGDGVQGSAPRIGRCP